MTAAQFGPALRQARRRQGLSLRGLQALVRYDFTYLGQVERGEKPGSIELADCCDRALAAGGRLVAVFRACDSTAAATDLGGATGPAVESATHYLSIDLENLRALYHGEYPINDLALRVRGCLAENAHRLRGVPHASIRRRLLHARADAALLAGRLALFDTWVPIAARGYLTMACEAAAESGDDALVAAACGHLAFVSAREHHATACVDHLQTARRHAERTAVPGLVSWVAAVEAELLAPTDASAGLRAVDRAVDALARSAGAPSPGWFDYYSAARLDGFRGRVLLSAGRSACARQTLTAALDDLEPHAVKQRAVLWADLAIAHLGERDPDVDAAATCAGRAAAELARTHYLAAAERLATLRDQLEPWRGTRAVRELDDALAEHVA